MSKKNSEKLCMKHINKIVTEMSVDGSVSGGSGEPLSFPVLDMLALRTHEFLCQSKINNEDSMSVSSGALSY